MSPPHPPIHPSRSLVGVTPAAALEENRGLFEALEVVFPVRFESRAPSDEQGLDGALILGDSLDPPARPCLIAAPGASERNLADRQDEVRFASSPALDPCLRGASLHDARAARLMPLTVGSREQVLATGPNGPVWTRRGEGEARVDRVALSPVQQHDSSLPLRAQLRVGRFLSMLPLAVFLRELSEPHQWSRPPLRASIVIDDPNLRRPTYGFINFRDLASHAAQHGYHVAIGSVPLDSWPVSGSAARVFAEARESVSLCIHGLAHSKHELERFRSTNEARRELGLALRRVASLERRAGVRVDRVMVAPHERCSALSTEAMLRLGFEALVIDRANPWRFRPEEERPVAGWELAELVSGGLPVIRRESLRAERDDLILRAFLGQPLVLYGHHDDLADGPDLLAAVAGEIDRLGDVRWMSLGEIARTNYLQRRTGSLLRVRMLSRQARLRLPEGVSEISVEMPAIHGASEGTVSIGDVSTRWELDGRNLRSSPTGVGGDTVDVLIAPPAAPPAAGTASHRAGAWTLCRRLIAEGRDRAAPVGRHLARDAA